MLLDSVEKIAGREIAVLTVGTDGSSPAAGAVADGETLARARVLGLDPADYFERSDSYTFFSKLGDAIETGPTGNNLRICESCSHVDLDGPSSPASGSASTGTEARTCMQ